MTGSRQVEIAVYGRAVQAEWAARVGAASNRVPATRLLKLPHCGHSPQRDEPEAVIAAAPDFITTRR